MVKGQEDLKVVQGGARPDLALPGKHRRGAVTEEGVPYRGSTGPANGEHSSPVVKEKGKLVVMQFAREYPRAGYWAGRDNNQKCPERPDYKFVEEQDARAERFLQIEKDGGWVAVEKALALEVEELGLEQAAILQGVRASPEELAELLEVRAEAKAIAAHQPPCPMFGTMRGCRFGYRCAQPHDKARMASGNSFMDGTCERCGGWTCDGGKMGKQFCWTLRFA